MSALQKPLFRLWNYNALKNQCFKCFQNTKLLYYVMSALFLILFPRLSIIDIPHSWREITLKCRNHMHYFKCIAKPLINSTFQNYNTYHMEVVTADSLCNIVRWKILLLVHCMHLRGHTRVGRPIKSPVITNFGKENFANPSNIFLWETQGREIEITGHKYIGFQLAT